MKKQTTSTQPTETTLITPGNSKRLMEIRKKAMGVSAEQKTSAQSTGLKQTATNQTLQQAQAIIDQTINRVHGHLPPNKKNRLFAIRFGMSEESLKKLPIEAIFDRLKLNKALIKNWKQLAKLDYHGSTVAKT